LDQLIEWNDIARMKEAFVLFGPAMRDFRVSPPAVHATGSLAHEAVWFRHWDMCEWLESVGCFAHELQGDGSAAYWVSGRTPMQYAEVRSCCGIKMFRYSDL
jgi:hypothetical protein